MQNTYMDDSTRETAFARAARAGRTKEASVTVRLPVELKRALAARARRETRSLSAQIERELTKAVADEPFRMAGRREKFLGRFAGGAVPSDRAFREARELLSRSLRAIAIHRARR
jgi:hypothetical protein